MALARARRGRYQANYWPGFVDMLSTLLLVVTFLMSLFMLTNYFVSQAASGSENMALAGYLAPLAGAGGDYTIKFRFASDLSFDDSDGQNPTTCGAAGPLA